MALIILTDDRTPEIVGRKTIHLVIRAVHDETNAGGDLAEFAEDELIIHEVKKIKYIFLKIQHVLRIIMIGIISHNNLWAFDDIFLSVRF